MSYGTPKATCGVIFGVQKIFVVLCELVAATESVMNVEDQGFIDIHAVPTLCPA